MSRFSLISALAAALLANGAVHAADPAPPAQLAALSAPQRAFIEDEANLKRFGLTKEKLYIILARQDNATAAATVDSLMKSVEAAKYQPGPTEQPTELLEPMGDMAAVPLNPAAGDYNSATVLRPAALDDVQREPGPFSLHRYVNEPDPIPTFANAPVAIRKEDLLAGKVQVAFVGVPLDLSSGWRDSQNAPDAMRAMYGSTGYDIYAGIDPALALNIVDYGNLSVDKMSVELSVDHVRKMIGEMADAGTVPFIVGGDHSIMFPTVAAMTDHYGAGKVGILQLDAHHEGARDQAHFITDEQSLGKLLQDRLVRGADVVQVGLRGPDVSPEDLAWLGKQGVKSFTMADIEGQGWQKILASALQAVRSGPENVFVSFDMSVLDPAYASGSGRPAPGGLTIREAVPLVRRVCAETKVVGFEMLDVAPYLDLSYATAMNGNYIMHACMTGIAMRKMGVKEPG